MAWSTYLAVHPVGDGGDRRRAVPRRRAGAGRGRRRSQLLDWDPDGEVKLVTAMLYSHTHLPEAVLEQRVRAMTVDERLAVIRAYVGRPGQPPAQARAGPSSGSPTASTCWPTTAPSATCSATGCSPSSGSSSARGTASPAPRRSTWPAAPSAFDEAMERSAALHDALVERFPAQAPYAVSLAYKVRFYMQLNAREAMHLLELRTTPQGHPAYRVVGQEMHRLIAEQAGHRAVAEAMRYVDHSPEPEPRAPRRRAPGRGPPPEPLTAPTGRTHRARFDGSVDTLTPPAAPHPGLAPRAMRRRMIPPHVPPDPPAARTRNG